MDNTDNFEDTFARYRQNTRPLGVGDDFENRVFSKIKKKKKQRKVIASAAAGIVIFAFVFIAQAVLDQKDPGQQIMAYPGTAVKEEVPVIDDVIFASSDSQTTYAIEQVAYTEDDDTI